MRHITDDWSTAQSRQEAQALTTDHHVELEDIHEGFDIPLGPLDDLHGRETFGPCSITLPRDAALEVVKVALHTANRLGGFLVSQQISDKWGYFGRRVAPDDHGAIARGSLHL